MGGVSSPAGSFEPLGADRSGYPQTEVERRSPSNRLGVRIEMTSSKHRPLPGADLGIRNEAVCEW